MYADLFYFCSKCQAGDWPRHKMTCRRTHDLVGTPFIVSLPQSQLTYARLYDAADAYARCVPGGYSMKSYALSCVTSYFMLCHVVVAVLS